MPFDWTQYLILAKSLSQSIPHEASLRSAISRSYYSAFNLALERAKLNGYRDKVDETGGSHQLLWDLYGRNIKSNECGQIAKLGPRMKRRRVLADYRSEYPRLAEEVRFAIQDADACIALLARLPARLPEDAPRSWSY